MSPTPTPSPARRSPRRAAPAQRSTFERVFDAVASPWAMAAGLAVLGGLHLSITWRLLAPQVGGWTALSIQAAASGLIAASAIAIGVQRVWPALGGGAGARRDAVLADVVCDDDAGKEGLEVRGVPAVLGAAVAVLGVLVIAVLPIFQAPGLAQGGVMTLDARSGAEAAVVDLNGVQVKQNLGGLKFEVLSVELGRLAGGATPASVLLKITNIPTNEARELVVGDGEPVLIGDLLLSLEGVEPAPEPVGLQTRVVDARDQRAFDLLLKVGAPVKDPAGEGEFVLESIEPTNPTVRGARITGFATEAPGAEPQLFTLWDADPGYDAAHRKGRYALTPVRLVPGYQARLRVAQPPPFDPALVGFALLLLGVALTVAVPQRSTLRVRRGERATAAISSINDAAGAALDAVGHAVPAASPEEDR